MKPNRYRELCATCGQMMEPGEGFYETTIDEDTLAVTGRRFFHHPECPSKQSAPGKRDDQQPVWGVYVEGGVAIAKGEKPTPDAVPLCDAARRIDAEGA